MQNCIISYTGEGEHFWPLVEQSIELAKARVRGLSSTIPRGPRSSEPAATVCRRG